MVQHLPKISAKGKGKLLLEPEPERKESRKLKDCQKLTRVDK